ncbi:hypothetical protein AgCh_021027 [Apium graveolens]
MSVDIWEKDESDRYSIPGLGLLGYEDIPLALEAACVGLEIRVVGNDSGEKVMEEINIFIIAGASGAIQKGFSHEDQLGRGEEYHKEQWPIRRLSPNEIDLEMVRCKFGPKIDGFGGTYTKAGKLLEQAHQRTHGHNQYLTRIVPPKIKENGLYLQGMASNAFLPLKCGDNS